MESNMNEDVSKVTSLIPDLYYDIIARMTVGIFFEIGLLYLIITHQHFNPIQIKDWVVLFNPLIIFFFFIFTSYIFGYLISILSIPYQDFLNIGFNPDLDMISNDIKIALKKIFFLFIEFFLGFPFSIFFIRYTTKGFEKDYKIKLKSLIDSMFPEVKESSILRLCRDYVRSNNNEFGTILIKRQAETVMCRGLAIVMLFLIVYSIIYSSWKDFLFEWLAFALSTSVYSQTRRAFVANIYRHFFLIQKLSAKESGP
jgi:hypothetical protein